MSLEGYSVDGQVGSHRYAITCNGCGALVGSTSIHTKVCKLREAVVAELHAKQRRVYRNRDQR